MATAEEKVQQLRQHFDKIKSDDQSSHWEAMWQQQVTPWDRSAPHDALIDILNNRTSIIGGPMKDGKRRRALVPGCGGGYDVVLLASYGYDAVGLDTAPTAVKNARALQESEERHRNKYPVHDTSLGAGRADFYEANFFDDTFLSQAASRQFDLIYDYTFLCALPPDMRPKWARRMRDLLAPGGTLICLEFPLGKPLSAGGPPHGLSSAVYVELFKNPGAEIDYEDGEVVVGGEQTSNALKRIDHWVPERSHHAGQGKDMVSLWQET